MSNINLWTVVQHSAYGYAGDEQFIAGLETRNVTTKKDHDAVIKAGGVLYESYMEAEDFAETAMYPENFAGIIPNAQGTFSDKKVDGLAIYVPVRQVVG